MKIKICGIKTLDEAKIINETMPDFIGFVFAQSRRMVSFSDADKIKAILNPQIETVGVFVDLSINEIIKYKKIIDTVQFSGQYSEKDIEIAKNEGYKAIKVIHITKDEYEINTKADYVLLDTYSPTQAGGLNKAFNWDIKIKSNVPFFVAGGINENNMLEMAKKLKPYGADVSSGAESEGFKTKEKVSNIIKIAKGINL